MLFRLARIEGMLLNMCGGEALIPPARSPARRREVRPPDAHRPVLRRLRLPRAQGGGRGRRRPCSTGEKVVRDTSRWQRLGCLLFRAPALPRAVTRRIGHEPVSAVQRSSLTRSVRPRGVSQRRCARPISSRRRRRRDSGSTSTGCRCKAPVASANSSYSRSCRRRPGSR
jgi:hypothetical protein